ncbi:hypothetical protein CETAM_02315 [Corynebacterium comes]|uniref:Uncharacterized protein n=1 Tax=Corynebacterium comes TaxID=2675218 RepID=A0A6B8VHV0_9CORY|nr:hypothetical protein CETAM_02315 [Corynebacterium comes]
MLVELDEDAMGVAAGVYLAWEKPPAILVVTSIAYASRRMLCQLTFR